MTKKEQILITAEQLFSENGYDKTTMDDIATRLNIRKGGIYYHFKNKEDIMKQVVEKQVKLFKEHIIKSVEAVEKQEDKLKAYINGRLDFLEQNEHNYNYLKQDFVKTYHFVKSCREEMENWEKDFINKLSNEQINKKKPNNECRLLADVVDTFCKGLEVSWFLDENDKDLHKRCETFTELITANCNTKYLYNKDKKGQKDD